MNQRRASAAIVLIMLLSATLFLALDPLKMGSPSDFYFGVEFAYSHNLNDSQVNLNNLKALVDKVKDYTNLFVIGIPEISLNQVVLNASCNYIYNAGLSFIVLFTDVTTYSYYPPISWTTVAHEKYGDKFLGVYRLDEPGGKEIENNTEDRFLNPAMFNPQIRNYTGASEVYVDSLHAHINYFHQVLYSTIFTSDFGLYWFDYKAGYDTVFTQFVWNQSRQLAISLCRGAAVAQNKSWGAIITWMYDQWPYLESGGQLYSDMTLAFDEGAKYVVVFDYPNTTQYGTLTDEHFTSMQNFWNYIQSNPQKHGSDSGEVAYVLPQDYGFRFGNSNDNIWGLWSADNLSSKVWNDANNLINQYGSRLDIVFNDPQFMHAVASRYDKLFFWNETAN